MFYDPKKFAFTERLERDWQTIYEEYLDIQNELIDWHERDLYGAGWKVFGLFNFPDGEAIEANAKRCQYTASLVHNQIPGHGAVGFSMLKPMTKIRRHQGYPGAFLRCHLGLRTPSGDCALSVSREIRRWEEGRVLIFDDRFPHEAWNLTSEERVVLLIDFIPPNPFSVVHCQLYSQSEFATDPGRRTMNYEGKGGCSGSTDKAP